MTRRSGVIAMLLIVVLGGAAAVFARTRSFPVPVSVQGRVDATDYVDQFAYLTEEAPLTSHAGHEVGANLGIWGASLAYLNSTHSILIRYDLTAIPKGMRITNAELVMPVYTYSPADTRFFVYRVLADWGNGASYKYRYNTPEKKVEWSMPGARGGSTDRATGSTASFRVKAAGEVVLNVTSDVEMWYTKAAPNNGWLFTVEESTSMVGFYSHIYHGYSPWVLRVTYEPE
jgi:hypothetical protein